MLAFGFSVQAQEIERYSSTRLENLVNQLKRQTVDLVDRTSEDLRRGRSNSRQDIEAAFLAHQLDASAGLFSDMVRNQSNAAELRDGASLLTDLARRAPNYGSNSYLWRNAQNAVNDINRELGSYGGGGSGNNNGGGAITGRAYWRGMVDDVVHLIVRGRDIRVRSISGRPYPEGNFSFTSALPTRNVSVEVDKKRGRGDVQVVQQPSRSNDYTAVIEIRDRDGGAREYQIEVFWR